MKLYIKTINILFVSIILFSSCNTVVDPIQPSDQLLTANVTHTIDSLILMYSTVVGDLPTRTPKLFTVDTIPSNKEIIINGIVVSDDNEGNIYKYLVIQDSKTGYPLKISVDAGNLSALFPLGTALSINCSGLAIGKYAEMLQLGIPFYNTTSGKTGYEIGRIPYTYFLTKIKVNIPTAAQLAQVLDTVTISQILTAGPKWFGKLVCIKNANFTGKGADYGKPLAISEALQIFAPPTNGIGFPQSREIQDGTGSVFVATSEYSKFATYKLPSSTIKGNITAIVGWYNDKDATIDPTKIYHQLTLRSLNDLNKGFESYHQSLQIQ